MEEVINIEVIEKILNEYLPLSNKKEVEPYGKLLRDLKKFKLFFSDELRFLLEKHREKILAADKQRVIEIQSEILINGNALFESNKERLRDGVFYGHVGLTQEALKEEFGEYGQEFPFRGKV